MLGIGVGLIVLALVVALVVVTARVRRSRMQRRSLHKALQGQGVSVNSMPSDSNTQRLGVAAGAAATAVKSRLDQARQLGASVVQEDTTTVVYGSEVLDSGEGEKELLNVAVPRGVC